MHACMCCPPTRTTTHAAQPSGSTHQHCKQQHSKPDKWRAQVTNQLVCFRGHNLRKAPGGTAFRWEGGGLETRRLFATSHSTCLDMNTCLGVAGLALDIVAATRATRAEPRKRCDSRLGIESRSADSGTLSVSLRHYCAPRTPAPTHHLILATSVTTAAASVTIHCLCHCYCTIVVCASRPRASPPAPGAKPQPYLPCILCASPGHPLSLSRASLEPPLSLPSLP